MRYGLERLEELPVSVRLIREIHQRLLRGVRGSRLTPGDLRTSQNWIGPAGCSLNEATFVPPSPDAVPQALSDLERFIHAEDNLPVLIKIGLAHGTNPKPPFPLYTQYTAVCRSRNRSARPAEMIPG